MLVQEYLLEHADFTVGIILDDARLVAISWTLGRKQIQLNRILPLLSLLQYETRMKWFASPILNATKSYSAHAYAEPIP
jgi:hypothetical protein